MEQKELVTINHLTKAFKKVIVIEDLNHTFYRGERIALVGQNGAGKTTLIRCILGLYRFEGGLEVLGMDPRTQREDILHYVGFVPQIPPPIKMTVSEMLTFFGTITKTDEQYFLDIAERLGLDVEANANKPFLKLSGGMKQKLLIALALGRKPKILLLDEPSANLDPQARKALFELLHEVSKDVLMIISSHRIDEVKGLVNRLVEMDLGKIVVNKAV